jgi:hypothetical protein
MVAALRCSVGPRGANDEAQGVMVALGSDPNWLVPALLQVAMDATDDATADAAVTAVTEQVAGHFMATVAAPSADAWLNWSIAHMSRLDPESPIVTWRFERLCAAMPRSSANGPTLADVAADTVRVPATRRAAALKALWRYPLSPQVQSVDLLASYMTTATSEELFEAATGLVLRVALQEDWRSFTIEEAAVTCMPALLDSVWHPAASMAAVALLPQYPEDLLPQLAIEVARTSPKHIEWLRTDSAPWKSRLAVCELLSALYDAVGPPSDADVLKKVIAVALDLLAEDSDTLSWITTPYAGAQHAANTTAILRLVTSLMPTTQSDSSEHTVPEPSFFSVFVADVEPIAGRDEWQSRRAAAATMQCFSNVPQANIPVAIARLVNDTNVIVWCTALQAPLSAVIDQLPTITEHAVATLRDHSNATLQWVVLSALTTLLKKLDDSRASFGSANDCVEEDDETSEQDEGATTKTFAHDHDHVLVCKWIPVVSEVMNRTANPFTFAAAGNLLARLCNYHYMWSEDCERLDQSIAIHVFDSTLALLQADCQRFQPAAVRLTTFAGDEAEMTDSVYEEVASACALSAVHVELLSVVTALVSKYREFILTTRVMDLFWLIHAQGRMSAATQSVLGFYNFFVTTFPERVAGVVDVILPHVLFAITAKLLPSVRASMLPRHLRQADTTGAFSLWDEAQMVPHPSSVDIQDTIWEGAALLNALLEWAAESSKATATLSRHAFDLANAVMALSRYPLVTNIEDQLGSLHRFIGQLIVSTASEAPSGAMLAQLIRVALNALRCRDVEVAAWDGLGKAIKSNVKLIEDPCYCRNANPAASKPQSMLCNRAIDPILTALSLVATDLNGVVVCRFIENISSVTGLALKMQPEPRIFNWVLSKMARLGNESSLAHYAQLMLAAQIIDALHDVGREFTTEFRMGFTDELLALTSASAALANNKAASEDLNKMTISLVDAGFLRLLDIAETYDIICEADADDPMAALFLPLEDVLLRAPMDYLKTSIAEDPVYANTTGLAVASLLRAYATGRLLGDDTVELAETVLSITVNHLPLRTDTDGTRAMVYGVLIGLLENEMLASSQVSAELKTRIAVSVLSDTETPNALTFACEQLIRGSRPDQASEEPQRKRHNSRR